MSQVKVEEQIGGAVIKLRGQFIGGPETDEMRDTLKSLAEKQTNSLIIDLENVTYLNSTALGVLISSHTNFTKRNGKIILCNVSKSLENIFVITKLTLVFTITDTLSDALKLINE
ncbi:MAG TPA: STAS domain-containing protein [Candidatus Kapabacteria bacterium]|nr:STAS domain-containing protein [Candidatus Kapabacteria bacterium]